MGILLSKVRIKNYRSIESLTLDLGTNTLLIGQNNSGKTNFLKALNLAVSGTSEISEEDIFVARDERLERKKEAYIDIQFQPTDENGVICLSFSKFWTEIFTDTWIRTIGDYNFVGIRMEIKFDPIKYSYGLIRHCILEWKDSFEDTLIESKSSVFNEDMRIYLQCFYMDANRDIVQDLRNRNSYFGRLTSSKDLSKEAIDEIEACLNDANTKIIENIPSLRQTQISISSIGQTIGSFSSKVEIEPLARKISDLNKGMDIVMQDGDAAPFPVSQHGYGTRSWISFLSMSAFVEMKNKIIKEDGGDDAEQFFLLTMEEPEAHLHPQAQRRLFEQISHFKGQKVVSTHSPNIVAQSALTDIIYFSKRGGKTVVRSFKERKSNDDDEKIFREVINTRADLLFASAVILCEGITEEIALSIFFNEYFGCAPYIYGVSIISAGGQKYHPYLSLIETVGLTWFIFSDGESETDKTVKGAVESVFGKDTSELLNNVVKLENDHEYETYLISEGYGDDIIKAICDYEDDEKFLDKYIDLKDKQNRSNKIAKKLNKETKRDYKTDIENGRVDALIDLCLENKTRYAKAVAKKIVASTDKEKRIPKKVAALFLLLQKVVAKNKQISISNFDTDD
ncbi:MAG: AAA family ATPase [Deltaproteobacteria bacterium]|jgi:putative ATP-dependent endonuclease of OLD family|nr:AAA family ATPase [Deltaproteobacteria bacterium]